MFLKFIKSLIVISIVLCSIILLILVWFSMMNINFYNISTTVLKVLLWFVIFLFIALRWLDIYMTTTTSDSNILKDMQILDPDTTIKYHTNTPWYVLRYLELGDPTKPTLIFIHGTPGSMTDAFPFLKKTDILTQYHIIIPDRPGFGGSMKGNEMSTIKEQSEILSELLFLSGNSQKVTLVGRSYAGALLPYMAAQYGEKIQSMTIIAGTMAPDHQTIWKISYPLHYTWLRYIIPSMLRVTNAEKLASINQLNILSSAWKKITVPVWLIHGKKDRIVKIENTYYAEKMLHNSPKVIVKILEDIGHEIPLKQPQIIVDVINELHQ